MDKDIRFTEKKVDESWKDQASREKAGKAGPSADAEKLQDKPESSKQPPVTSKVFLNLLSSFGFQAMMHLGEIPSPDTQKRELNLEAAREMIDLLIQLKEKTRGNLSSEEMDFFNTLLPELQLKFSQHV